MYEYNFSSDLTLQTPAFFGDVIELFSLVPGMNMYYQGDRRYVYDRHINTFFWGDYVDGSSTIKLYELTHHKLNIRGSELKVVNANFSEFEKPGVGDKYWQTQITSLDLSTLLNNIKTNTTFKIYISPYEANKSQFMMDMIKYVFIFLGLLIIIIIEVGLGVDGKVIGWTILGYITIMGGIGWAV